MAMRIQRPARDGCPWPAAPKGARFTSSDRRTRDGAAEDRDTSGGELHTNGPA